MYISSSIFNMLNTKIKYPKFSKYKTNDFSRYFLLDVAKQENFNNISNFIIIPIDSRIEIPINHVKLNANLGRLRKS